MANELAFSDIGTKLYVKGANSTYTKLVGIKSVPASGGEPATLDATELESERNQYIPDRTDSPNQTFTYNRTEEKYEAVSAICDGAEHEFLVVFKDKAGTYIKGTAVTYKNEVSKGSVLEATLVITPVDIQDKTSAQVIALIPSLSA